MFSCWGLGRNTGLARFWASTICAALCQLQRQQTKGIGFINSLTCDKLENAGLKPYKGKLDKGYMLSLLNSTGKFDIKLELPDNYEK